MAVESRPLFHPEVMRQQVRVFHLPEGVAEWQPKLQRWAELIGSGRADGFKETELLPEFLSDIFCGLLGYTGPAGAAGLGAQDSSGARTFLSAGSGDARGQPVLVEVGLGPSYG
jgi:hypothetical protein